MAKEVNEGTSSSHPYSLDGEDGNPVATVEGLKIKLSTAAQETIFDWKDIPLLPSGTIKVTGLENTLSASEKGKVAGSMFVSTGRYITIAATHNGGDTITKDEYYTIVDIVGIIDRPE